MDKERMLNECRFLIRMISSQLLPFLSGLMANHQNTFESCPLSHTISFEHEFICVSSCPIWKTRSCQQQLENRIRSRKARLLKS